MRLAAACLSLSIPAAALTAGNAGPLDTPDLTPYDPVEVLCSLGKDKSGEPKIQPWCKDWLMCIKTKANPAGTPAAVKTAWGPADCKEVCGEWPAMSPKEGKKKLFLQDANSSAMGLIDMHTENACLKSCAKFQESLTTCVANIMFEPGKVAAMGIPKKGGKAPAAICTKKDSPCMPDLEINHQKCISHKTKSVLDKGYKISDKISSDCKFIKMHMEDCKKCPQLQEKYQSVYATFTGGCMDQLNAYHQATHPKAGKAAIPGAKGCKVH
jgi:hypothetical protein